MPKGAGFGKGIITLNRKPIAIHCNLFGFTVLEPHGDPVGMRVVVFMCVPWVCWG